MDESENQEEGPLGRHSGHTARNGLASATLPVRVVTALSVNAPNPAPLLPPCFLPYTCTPSHAVHPCFFLLLLRFHPYPPSLLFFPSLIYSYVYNIYIPYIRFVTLSRLEVIDATPHVIFVAPPPSTRLIKTLRSRTSYLLSYFPHSATYPPLPRHLSTERVNAECTVSPRFVRRRNAFSRAWKEKRKKEEEKKEQPFLPAFRFIQIGIRESDP